MRQSNAEFIPNFAEEAAILSNLTRERCKFRSGQKHQNALGSIIQKFNKEMLIMHFDMKKVESGL